MLNSHLFCLDILVLSEIEKEQAYFLRSSVIFWMYRLTFLPHYYHNLWQALLCVGGSEEDTPTSQKRMSFSNTMTLSILIINWCELSYCWCHGIGKLYSENEMYICMYVGVSSHAPTPFIESLYNIQIHCIKKYQFDYLFNTFMHWKTNSRI